VERRVCTTERTEFCSQKEGVSTVERKERVSTAVRKEFLQLSRGSMYMLVVWVGDTSNSVSVIHVFTSVFRMEKPNQNVV